MRLQLEKKTLHTAALACAAFLLAAAGLILLLCMRGSAEKSPVLGKKDGWGVARGAPEQAGQETRIARASLLRGTLLLVSPDHPLPQDFPVPNTRAIRAMVGTYLPVQPAVALEREAVYALCSMQLEHPLEEGLLVVRGTLSAAQQEEWRREAFSRYAKVYPLSEALSRSMAAVPGSGESEHQTGYALDIALQGALSLGAEDPLTHNETGRWLADNLWRFGFIYRYAPGQDDEGGCEGVHLRYIGPVHAAALHALGMGLEEYWALLRREGMLTLYREGKPYAYLYCAPCEGDWRIRLPKGTDYQVSADNTGWAVAAIAAEERF